jgi:hypothetical protein
MKQNKSNEYQQWSNHIGVWYRGNFKNNQPIGYHESNMNTTIGQEDTIVNFHIR